MAKAAKAKQLSFSMPDRPGLLSEVTNVVRKAKVDITAICAYAMDNSAFFMLNTDSSAKARKALASLGVAVEEEGVVAVEMPNKVGELEKVAKKIAEAGINIGYMYGTAATGKTSICIFKTSDDMRAIRVINK